MKKVWLVAGIAGLVAILGVALVGAVALAQDDGSSPFDFRQRFREALASALGITVEQYDAAVEKAQNQVVDEGLSEGWLTQDQADQMRERMQEGPGFGRHGMGRGFMGPKMGFWGRGGESPLAIAAEQLGMTEAEVMDALQAGKSIADLAKEKGVDPTKITDAYLAQLEQTLTQAVADGKITQKQADWMLEQAKTRVPEMLDQTGHPCGPGGFPGGGRPGRMWNAPDDSEA